jgi:hypothetical protein
VCRYVPFSALLKAEQLGEASWRHMKFSYLEDELGESLELGEV